MASMRALVVGLLVLCLVCQPALAKKDKKGPKVTVKVFFDISIGGKDAGVFLPFQPITALRFVGR